MKHTLFIILFFIGALSACKKTSENTELEGSWRLTEVYDKTTGTVSQAPAGAAISIVLTFLDGRSFAGHTFRNSLSDGKYTQTGDDIIFESFSTTKIAEDQWGQSFLAVLYGCYLQSASPCAPSKITVQGNTMTIATPLRYNITLEKL